MCNQYTTLWHINGECDRYLVDPDKREYRRARMSPYPELLHVSYRSAFLGGFFERIGMKENKSLKIHYGCMKEKEGVER